MQIWPAIFCLKITQNTVHNMTANGVPTVLWSARCTIYSFTYTYMLIALYWAMLHKARYRATVSPFLLRCSDLYHLHVP